MDDYEINSLITALRNLNNTVNNRKISLTLEKLETMRPYRDSTQGSENVIPINIDYSNWNSNNKDKEKLKALNKAISEKKLISFDYINSKGEYTHRIAEPLSLLLKDFSWYLQGYCRIREDYRLFKVKRMRKVNITKDAFTREAPPLETLDYSEEWYRDKAVLDIVLKFKPEARLKVVDSFNEEQIQFFEDGTTEVRFAMPEDIWLFELLLGFGSQVEVIEPLCLRKRIRQTAVEINNIYKEDE